jgi:peptide/nickel transport system permease protein
MKAMPNGPATWGALLAALLVASAVFAPLLAPRDPAALDLALRLSPPSPAHWLGADELGRDVLSRLLYGARVSLIVGTGVVALSLAAGLLIGAAAGFYGGWLDRFFNQIVINTLQAFPGVLLAIAVVSFAGQGLGKLVVALSLGGWIGYARLVRGQVMSVKERDFVQAARALGARDVRVIVRHILPNIVQPIIVQSAIGMATAVISEATLSFLGLGIPPPAPSWGSMLNDGRGHLFDAPHLVIFPALAVMVAVLAFNFLGDGLGEGQFWNRR